MICSKILTTIEKDLSLQVTFIGNKEQWRVEQKKYQNMYPICKDDIYKWLQVLSNINVLFKDRNIQIDNSQEKKKEI